MMLMELLFGAGMLLLPWIFMRFYKPYDEAKVDMHRIRRLRLRLNLWTLVVVAAWSVGFYAESADAMGWWNDLPWIFNVGLRGHSAIQFAFFPLWFGLAMPLLQASRPEAASAFHSMYKGSESKPRQVRSASLTKRSPVSHVPRYAYFLLHSIWILGSIICVYSIWAQHAELSAVNPRYWLMPALSLPMAMMIALIMPACLRALAAEPEPLDGEQSPELMDAYARLRAVKIKGFFGLFTCMALLMSAMPVVMLWWGVDGRFLGMVGATAGSSLGIAGAVFGTLMGNRRMHINRLLSERSEAEVA